MTGAAKVLLHVFPTFDVGGAQMRFCQLANHFGRSFRHLIVSMNGGTDAFRLLSGEVDAEILKVPVHKGETWKNLRTFRDVLLEIRPHRLVTSNWGSIEWAMANLGGTVRHLHMEDGFGPEEAHGQIPRRVWTRRLVLRRSTVMLPSLTLLTLARDVWRLPRRRLIHIPNGVDCGRFGIAPDPAFAASLGIGGEGPVIGTVAALRAEKNLRRLIDAFALVNARIPARLAIVGGGPERAALLRRATELGVSGRVILTGPCPAPERLLPGFAVFALSSDTEQMPLSLLEAMAAGRPVAATDVGDVRAMVAPENSGFVVPRDTGLLAEALHSLLADPARATAIGQANAARARAVYDQSLMFAAYRRLFDG